MTGAPSLSLPHAPSPAEAISPGGLLAEGFRGPSWARWRAVLRAAYGEALTPEELTLFREVAQRDPPKQKVRELYVIAGRRSGKDSIAAAIAVTTALGDYSAHLRPGEKATVMCLASDRPQARIIKRYIAASFTESAILSRLVTRQTEEGLDLANDVEVIVSTNSFRAVRGRAVICGVMDELAYWRDESSANPDHETYTALEPALATLPGSMLIGISSPYRRGGLLFSKFQKHFGKNDDDILVVKGPTTAFNPTIPQRIIDSALERDPEAASAEWLGEFRSDIADFVSREAVAAVTPDGVRERPPMPSCRYIGFVDPSGGSADSMTLAIAHRDHDGVAILDAIREVRPPFSPESVVTEFARLLKDYRITKVIGDRYAGEWPRERFREHGITYEPSAKPKTDLYAALLPLLNSARVSLLDHPRLAQQLAGLERRTARGGRDSIDHAPGAHDDVANAVAGALVGIGLRRPPMQISKEFLARI